MNVTRWFVLVLIVIGAISMHAKADSTYVELEAESVLMRYFDALTQGDVFSMRRLMGGQLLETRSKLLENPGYPAYLGEMYARANFSVENIQLTGHGDVLIDVLISFEPEDGGAAHRQYLMRIEPASEGVAETGFRVHVETTPGNL